MYMTNTTMRVSMPTEIRKAIKRLSKKHNYASESGFLQHLVRREDAIDREKDKLRKLITQGIKSGISGTPPEQFFADLEKEIKQAAKSKVSS